MSRASVLVVPIRLIAIGDVSGHGLDAGLVMLIAVVVVLSNFTVDMLYAFIDPRIRYS